MGWEDGGGSTQQTLGRRCTGAHSKGLARRDTEWSLNEGRIPNPDVVRVAPGSSCHRVERNRHWQRASAGTTKSFPTALILIHVLCHAVSDSPLCSGAAAGTPASKGALLARASMSAVHVV
jgi:hypothetical protein